MSDRFLIVRLGAVGDVIHTLPLAAALRKRFPNARIGWAVEPGASALLRGNPVIDALCVVDTQAWRKGSAGERIAALRSDLRKLKEVRADAAIDAQGLIKSGLIARASGAKVRVGFEHRSCREGMNVLFTTDWAEPPAGPHHVVEKNLSLLGPLGAAPLEIGEVEFPLPAFAEEADGAESFLRREGLAAGRPLLIIHPGAGWETKRWNEERYAALGDAWERITGGDVLLSWGPEEEPLARQVADSMQSPVKVAPRTNIRELAALIRRCDVFAGGDSGPLHLAAALGVSCLAMMGPTDPVRNGPWGRGHAVLHHRLACSGCYGRTCPDIECLERIGADEAVQGLERIWNGHEKAR